MPFFRADKRKVNHREKEESLSIVSADYTQDKESVTRKEFS
jgi:hypothetical protein